MHPYYYLNKLTGALLLRSIFCIKKSHSVLHIQPIFILDFITLIVFSYEYTLRSSSFAIVTFWVQIFFSAHLFYQQSMFFIQYKSPVLTLIKSSSFITDSEGSRTRIWLINTTSWQFIVNVTTNFNVTVANNLTH